MGRFVDPPSVSFSDASRLKTGLSLSKKSSYKVADYFT